jgi:hypothetical protein
MPYRIAGITINYVVMLPQSKRHREPKRIMQRYQTIEKTQKYVKQKEENAAMEDESSVWVYHRGSCCRSYGHRRHSDSGEQWLLRPAQRRDVPAHC